MIYLIQHFEADFPQKVSLKILNSGIIMRVFQTTESRAKVDKSVSEHTRRKAKLSCLASMGESFQYCS